MRYIVFIQKVEAKLAKDEFAIKQYY